MERESGVKVYHITGGLDLTRKGSPREGMLEMYATSMDRQNIE